jgi:hypothetical protein
MKVTIGRLLDSGLIKKSTKVELVTSAELKSAGFIKLTKSKEAILVTKEDLKEKGLIK